MPRIYILLQILTKTYQNLTANKCG